VRSSTRHRVLLMPLVVAAVLSGAGQPAAGYRQPVYVGARVCATCHEGPGMGHQFSRWLLSKHALAYADLATPQAREMADLSGVPGEPREAMACLGCHATAADAEGWEKDPTFRTEDGVQCERCHGPGSEYIAEEVMRDREAAVAAGLTFLSVRECELCHAVKGSHVAVHDLPPLDMLQARETIAHPTPTEAHPGSLPLPAAGGAMAPAGSGHEFVGVRSCATCHQGPEMGYQFSRWRMGPHARAYAVLATPAATEIARTLGVDGDPQQSPDCLACHATSTRGPGQGFREGHSTADGVGCEACHGAGSDYAGEATMADRQAAIDLGMTADATASCAACHDDAHGRPFDLAAGLKRISHPTRLERSNDRPVYKTPVNLAMAPDGSEIYVACEASSSVIVVDAQAHRKRAEISVGRQPNDVAFSPDGLTAYVSNRLDDTVSVIDVRSRTVSATIPVGDEPHGLLTNRSGSLLFVLATAIDGVSVIDTSTFEEVKRLAASRNPWSLALSPDGSRVLVTNNLSRLAGFREPPISEVTVIDADLGIVEDRLEVPETNLIQGVAWHPSGEFAFVTINRTKNLVPMTRILQGWTITNGIGVLWRDGRVDQLLLDEPNLYFPDAADVAFSPDGRRALVTSSGSDRVAVIDVAKLVALLVQATDDERSRVIPNHLGKAIEFVVASVPTGRSPRGVMVSPDGKSAFVANALDDTLTVIDLEGLEATREVDLHGPRTITQVRRGERLFHSAAIAFQRQFSCHSCHPDGHVDSVTYDIEPDGIGFNPVDNRSLRGILDTAPFKWTGKNPSLARQCGPRLAVFFTRLEPFTPEELDDLTTYIATIPRPPNRHRPTGAPLTAAQRRGKAMFERRMTNDGREIAENDRCVTCHFPPLYTDRSKRDVGSKYQLDKEAVFDVPHLTNIYDSAPYMHNGMAETLEEIWTRFNPKDTHGVTNDMTKDQLNDLIEYLKTL
jgi:YVTN family beta-propeller protein